MPAWRVPGEDVFRTEPTGFVGLKNLVIGFRGPSLVYYASDYTEVMAPAPGPGPGPGRGAPGGG